MLQCRLLKFPSSSIFNSQRLQNKFKTKFEIKIANINEYIPNLDDFDFPLETRVSGEFRINKMIHLKFTQNSLYMPSKQYKLRIIKLNVILGKTLLLLILFTYCGIIHRDPINNDWKEPKYPIVV